MPAIPTTPATGRCPVCGAVGNDLCVAKWFPGETLPHASRTQIALPHDQSESEGPWWVSEDGAADGPSPQPYGESFNSDVVIDKDGMYVVVSGDSPARIAMKCVGSPHKWRELIIANPHKRKTVDGLTFARLQVGDRLHLPLLWPIEGRP